ncbi:hypothetical protein HRbin27_00052 [bacterium HR27]|nr:hypothetical protein HRbin27_00052 [bacterium HR27]
MHDLLDHLADDLDDAILDLADLLLDRVPCNRDRRPRSLPPLAQDLVRGVHEYAQDAEDDVECALQDALHHRRERLHDLLRAFPRLPPVAGEERDDHGEHPLDHLTDAGDEAGNDLPGALDDLHETLAVRIDERHDRAGDRAERRHDGTADGAHEAHHVLESLLGRRRDLVQPLRPVLEQLLCQTTDGADDRLGRLRHRAECTLDRRADGAERARDPLDRGLGVLLDIPPVLRPGDCRYADRSSDASDRNGERAPEQPDDHADHRPDPTDHAQRGDQHHHWSDCGPECIDRHLEASERRGCGSEHRDDGREVRRYRTDELSERPLRCAAESLDGRDKRAGDEVSDRLERRQRLLDHGTEIRDSLAEIPEKRAVALASKAGLELLDRRRDLRDEGAREPAEEPCRRCAETREEPLPLPTLEPSPKLSHGLSHGWDDRAGQKPNERSQRSANAADEAIDLGSLEPREELADRCANRGDSRLDAAEQSLECTGEFLAERRCERLQSRLVRGQPLDEAPERTAQFLEERLHGGGFEHFEGIDEGGPAPGRGLGQVRHEIGRNAHLLEHAIDDFDRRNALFLELIDVLAREVEPLDQGDEIAREGLAEGERCTGQTLSWVECGKEFCALHQLHDVHAGCFGRWHEHGDGLRHVLEREGRLRCFVADDREQLGCLFARAGERGERCLRVLELNVRAEQGLPQSLHRADQGLHAHRRQTDLPEHVGQTLERRSECTADFAPEPHEPLDRACDPAETTLGSRRLGVDDDLKPTHLRCHRRPLPARSARARSALASAASAASAQVNHAASRSRSAHGSTPR